MRIVALNSGGNSWVYQLIGCCDSGVLMTSSNYLFNKGSFVWSKIKSCSSATCDQSECQKQFRLQVFLFLKNELSITKELTSFFFFLFNPFFNVTVKSNTTTFAELVQHSFTQSDAQSFHRVWAPSAVEEHAHMSVHICIYIRSVVVIGEIGAQRRHASRQGSK